MQQLVASAQRQDAPQLTHLVASLVGLQDDGSSVIILHLGALDHLVGHVNVLGVVLVVVDLEGLLADLGLECSVVVREGRQRDFHRDGAAARLGLA
jgi:hypothetical protein